MTDNTDWKKTLTDDEYQVTRQAGTERPFTGVLLNEKRPGEYLCKCCGAVLFTADAKFDSHCGWPSFDRQSEDDNVEYHQDNSHGMRRTEIDCKSCGAHLGHVFPDGPTETGQRYCVNSLSLSFKTESDELIRG